MINDSIFMIVKQCFTEKEFGDPVRWGVNGTDEPKKSINS